MYEYEDDDDQAQQHDRLFLRLKILFSGYQASEEGHESTADYLTDNVLFKAYNYLLNGYTVLKKEEETSSKLKKLLQKISTEYKENSFGVKMSKIQINAILDQVKIISPYKNKIVLAEHGVFSNLQYFIDVPNGIRKIHLKKADQLLIKVFKNLINRSNIKELLIQDLKETKNNYNSIENQVDKKINAVTKMTTFYSNVFNELEQKLQGL